jgi:hypothetical protein
MSDNPASNPVPSSGQSAYTPHPIGLPPTAPVGAKIQAMKDAHAARISGAQPRHPVTKQFVKRGRR